MKNVKSAPAAVAPAAVAPAAVAPAAVAPTFTPVVIDAKAFTPHSLNARWNDVLCALVQSHGNQWAITALCKAEFNTYKVDATALPPGQLGGYIKGVAAYLTAIGYGPCIRYTKTTATADHEAGTPVLDDNGQRQTLSADAFGALVGDCKRTIIGTGAAAKATAKSTAKTKTAVETETTAKTETLAEGVISREVPRDSVHNSPVNAAPQGDGKAGLTAMDLVPQARKVLSESHEVGSLRLAQMVIELLVATI